MVRNSIFIEGEVTNTVCRCIHSDLFCFTATHTVNVHDKKVSSAVFVLFVQIDTFQFCLYQESIL
jgi:hypothetical protein